MRTDLTPPESFVHGSVEVTDLLERFLAVTKLDLSVCVQQKAEPMRDLSIEFTGPDVAMLLADRGELLEALGHLATSVCGEKTDRLLPSAVRISSGGVDAPSGLALPDETGGRDLDGTKARMAGHARGD